MKIFTRTLFAVLLSSAGCALAQSVAFITNLQGEVAVDGNSRPLVLSELAKGQKIVIGKDAVVSVMYAASGKEFTLKGPGEYQVKEAEVATTTGNPPAARSTDWRASNKVLAHVARTSSASVRMRSIAQPKPDTKPKLLFPTQGEIGTLQPAFRWSVADAAAPGEFTLLVAGQDKPVHRAKASGGSYRIPTRLKPDTEYAWMVSVAGEEIGTGKFRTLPAESIQLIEKRKPSDKAEFSDRLLFAMYLQEMGAVQEARDLWSRLAQERTDLPELSALAK